MSYYNNSRYNGGYNPGYGYYDPNVGAATGAVEGGVWLFGADLSKSGLAAAIIATIIYVTIAIILLAVAYSRKPEVDFFSTDNLGFFIPIIILLLFPLIGFITYFAVRRRKGEAYARKVLGHITLVPIYISAVALIILIVVCAIMAMSSRP